jgi:hypothetical protein
MLRDELRRRECSTRRGRTLQTQAHHDQRKMDRRLLTAVSAARKAKEKVEDAIAFFEAHPEVELIS